MRSRLRPDRSPVLYQTCLGLALVSALFLVAVSVLMTVNHFRLERADPLNAASLSLLRDQLKADPGNRELREEVRQLDLLARRAWHSGVAFNRTGIIFLVVGGTVLLGSLKTVMTIQERSTRRRPRGPRPDEMATFASARWVVGSVGLGIAAGALVLGLSVRLPDAGTAPPDEGGGSQARNDLWDDRSAHWPTFRGPDGNARAGRGEWPLEWAPDRNILWKTRIPTPGFNSPVVWDERIFLSGGDDEVLEVMCFDAGDGRLLWRHEVTGVPGSPADRPEVTEETGHAAPTMAVDGQRVYALFSTGDLVALDLEGTRLWAANLGVPDNPYGHASSLMIYKGLVIVQYDHWSSASVSAFDGATGAMVWKTPRETEITWTSPIIVHWKGQDQLVLTGNPYVTGYNPADGTELWRVECMTGEVASSPGFAEGMVFTANEYSMLTAIDLDAGPAIRWQYEWDLPEVSSVLATGERVYMANGVGTLTCLHQATGEVLWTHEFEEGFYSSPVLADGRVYLLDHTGVMRIVADADQFELLASSVLGEESDSTAAFRDGRLYIRGSRHLYCVGKVREDS